MPAHVLLVEDDPATAHAVARLLETKRFRVSRVETGEAALEAVDARHPDLVVLDLGLPDRDGLDVLRALRRAGDATRVLVLSGRSQKVDAVLALEAGADDFVAKPCEPVEFRERVHALLRRPARWVAEGERGVRRFGAVEVEPVSRTVRRGGEPVHLTPLEYGLLVALLERAGEVVSREELLLDVWGYKHAVPTETVTTYVSRLRKKLELDPAHPRHLITVRGTGYMLRTDPDDPSG